MQCYTAPVRYNRCATDKKYIRQGKSPAGRSIFSCSRDSTYNSTPSEKI